MAELQDEALDLTTRLDAVNGKIHREASNLVYLNDRADEIRQDVARSSDTGDLLAPAKAALEGHQQYVAASRAAIAAVTAGTPRQARPPFGDAVRSETRCPRCQISHERFDVTEEECYLISSDPSPAPGPSRPE